MKTSTLKKAETLKDLVIKNYNGTDQLSDFELKEFMGDPQLKFICHSDIDDNNYEITMDILDDGVYLSAILEGDYWHTTGRYFEDYEYDSIEDCSTDWDRIVTDYIDYWEDPENVN